MTATKRQKIIALRKSIKKWQDIVNGVDMDMGAINCECCHEYGANDHCLGCPIAEYAGNSHCEDTPYALFIAHIVSCEPGFNECGCNLIVNIPPADGDPIDQYCPEARGLALDELAYLKLILKELME